MLRFLFSMSHQNCPPGGSLGNLKFWHDFIEFDLFYLISCFFMFSFISTQIPWTNLEFISKSRKIMKTHKNSWKNNDFINILKKTYQNRGPAATLGFCIVKYCKNMLFLCGSKRVFRRVPGSPGEFRETRPPNATHVRWEFLDWPGQPGLDPEEPGPAERPPRAQAEKSRFC